MSISHAIRYPHYHSVQPLRCGVRSYSRAGEEWGYTPQYALVYLSAGGGWVEYEPGTRCELLPGDAFQRFPDKPHHFGHDSGTMTHFTAVPAETFSMMQQMGMRTLNSPLLHVGTRHGLAERHRRLIGMLHEALPEQLMEILVRMQSLIVDFHTTAARSARMYRPVWLEQACTALSSDLKKRVPLEHVARSLGIAYVTFRLEFKKHIGLSPGEYRINRRLEKAQEMLYEGEKLAVIAQKLGYHDQYAFSSQFKKYRGVSPSVFRKRW